MGLGFFDKHLTALPHPPIPLAIFLIAEEAISIAWQRLKKVDAIQFDLNSATEDEITHELYEILYDEIFCKGIVDGFDEEHFLVVAREAKLRNFSGENLDKMPDLLIGVAGREQMFRRSQDWLYIECKPIDSNHSVGVHYGSKGISRFICGDYAWAIPNALMVGYANPSYTIDPKLTETLQRRKKEFEVITSPTICPYSPASTDSEPVYYTCHRRTFAYLETGQKAPPIELRHLWLKK